jgi:hypothetical protein
LGEGECVLGGLLAFFVFFKDRVFKSHYTAVLSKFTIFGLPKGNRNDSDCFCFRIF